MTAEAHLRVTLAWKHFNFVFAAHIAYIYMLFADWVGQIVKCRDNEISRKRICKVQVVL